MSEKLQSFGWAVPASQVDAMRKQLASDGATLEPDVLDYQPSPEEAAGISSFEPLTMIVGGMALVALAKCVWSFFQDMNHSGLIVDVRKDPVLIREHPAIDRGKILIISADSREILDATTPQELDKLIAAALSH